MGGSEGLTAFDPKWKNRRAVDGTKLSRKKWRFFALPPPSSTPDWVLYAQHATGNTGQSDSLFPAKRNHLGVVHPNQKDDYPSHDVKGESAPKHIFSGIRLRSACDISINRRQRQRWFFAVMGHGEKSPSGIHIQTKRPDAFEPPGLL